ncbi:MAG TPA: hypothetical protein VIL72_04815 [Beijerinckiaceae bacterium]
MLPQTSTQRVTVVATGRDDQEVEEALQQMRVAAVASGSPEGLRAAAAFPGVRLNGGERVRLRDLGLQSQEFSGRSARPSTSCFRRTSSPPTTPRRPSTWRAAMRRVSRATRRCS